jgi:hypothetical protein
LKDVKAPKWKKGINWRPSKKTLKEFNSFYWFFNLKKLY